MFNFKRGDTVRLNTDALYNSGAHPRFVKGFTAKVQSCTQKELRLEGYSGWFSDPDKWERVSPETPMILSEDPTERKSTPITSGVLDYFPRALAAVAQCSKAGNDQHNPGQPLHWAKGKSTDHADCIARHLIDRHAIDTDGIPHMSKLAWRALALLETELEKAANGTK